MSLTNLRNAQRASLSSSYITLQEGESAFVMVRVVVQRVRYPIICFRISAGSDRKVLAVVFMGRPSYLCRVGVDYVRHLIERKFPKGDYIVTAVVGGEVIGSKVPPVTAIWVGRHRMRRSRSVHTVEERAVCEWPGTSETANPTASHAAPHQGAKYTLTIVATA